MRLGRSCTCWLLAWALAACTSGSPPPSLPTVSERRPKAERCAEPAPTWTGDVRDLVAKQCETCHSSKDHGPGIRIGGLRYKLKT